MWSTGTCRGSGEWIRGGGGGTDRSEGGLEASLGAEIVRKEPYVERVAIRTKREFGVGLR